MSSPADTLSSGGGGRGPTLAVASASGSEKSARLAQPSLPSQAQAQAQATKLRSCVTCRSRKVRCDKLSPCSHCRRADIPCVFPSADRPPRWARRLRGFHGVPAAGASAAGAPAAGEGDVRPPAAPTGDGLADSGAGPGDDAIDVSLVLERIRNLESLVRQLSGGSIEPVADGRPPPGGPSKEVRPGEPQLSAQSAHPSAEQFGRLVLDEGCQSRYVGSGFWSRVNDELDGLRAETRGLAEADDMSDESEAEHWRGPEGQEFGRAPSERHAFLFGHNLGGAGAADIRALRPLTSQIQFLFQTFLDNVNIIVHIIHVPKITKLVYGLVGPNPAEPTPSEEALMFSIYYAAVTSMESDHVEKTFGAAKEELSARFRLGLELSLAKGDFLNVPDFVLLQAFLIFLMLVRRHDSPRFVWMMTGLAIRMGQALGLQRDGSNFKDLSPYETEMRRRVWWAICNLDVRASEDQGTDLTIPTGTFDTKLPLNINDADINEQSKEAPPPRDEFTDMACALLGIETCLLTRRLVAPGPEDADTTLTLQSRILDETYERIDRVYLRKVADIDPILYWVGVTISRLVVSKLTLIIFLPTLFFSPSEEASAGIRDKLFIAAIEVAEYNHALNSEVRCRHWRWVYQTYTQWHAIAFMLMEITRRPWGPTVERAWVALHSRWLIPSHRADMNSRSLRAWIPLRKLMAKAKRHRIAELARLLADPVAVRLLETDDGLDAPGQRFEPLPNPDTELSRERWRKLVVPAAPPVPVVVTPGQVSSNGRSPSLSGSHPSLYADRTPASVSAPGGLPYGDMLARAEGGGAAMQHFMSAASSDFGRASGSNGSAMASPQGVSEPDMHSSGLTYPVFSESIPQPQAHAQQQSQPQPFGQLWPTSGPDGRSQFGSYSPWLWADEDPSVDVFGDVSVTPDGGGGAVGDPDVDMDAGMNWQDWFESIRGLEGDRGALPDGREGW